MTKETWSKVIDEMVAHGPNGTDEEIDQLSIIWRRDRDCDLRGFARKIMRNTSDIPPLRRRSEIRAVPSPQYFPIFGGVSARTKHTAEPEPFRFS
jgi:hypothetical protein